MRPEETEKCLHCKWQGKWRMMLICAPVLAWEVLLKWLLKQNYTDDDIVDNFIKDIQKELKNYDKTGS